MSIAVNSFNSRSREGATYLKDYEVKQAIVSIHAPVKERRRFEMPIKTLDFVSIHAPVKERQDNYR